MVHRGVAAVVVIASIVLESTAPGFLPWWRWSLWLPTYRIHLMMACSGIRFVSRYEWGARQPKNQSRLKVQPVPRFFVHHTEGPECFDYWSCSERMRHWQNFHMDTRGWDDLGYSFLIGGDGRVYVSRGWDRAGAHTKGHNDDALAAAFIGDFSCHLPTPWAVVALARLLQCGVALVTNSRPATGSSPDRSRHYARSATTEEMMLRPCKFGYAEGARSLLAIVVLGAILQASTTGAQSCPGVEIVSRKGWGA
ncbi:hypothetical protein HPB50_011491 [Hyalomma asiaticum]|uniref:Uncharacterized protein n=1 Tax=Hyalomma asiaticum TaxID=266040 RepID=A0ACB7RVN6_HYAAI|nr:hypothetical protein HPB50_011491 [Hyalomma asiaticum]